MRTNQLSEALIPRCLTPCWFLSLLMMIIHLPLSTLAATREQREQNMCIDLKHFTQSSSWWYALLPVVPVLYLAVHTPSCLHHIMSCCFLLLFKPYLYDCSFRNDAKNHLVWTTTTLIMLYPTACYLPSCLVMMTYTTLSHWALSWERTMRRTILSEPLDQTILILIPRRPSFIILSPISHHVVLSLDSHTSSTCCIAPLFGNDVLSCIFFRVLSWAWGNNVKNHSLSHSIQSSWSYTSLPSFTILSPISISCYAMLNVYPSIWFPSCHHLAWYMMINSELSSDNPWGNRLSFHNLSYQAIPNPVYWIPSFLNCSSLRCVFVLYTRRTHPL